MSDEHLEELLPFYAMGALTDAERARVDAYVAANPEARARLAEMTQASAALPLSVEPIQPPDRVKSKLMDRVRNDAGRRVSQSPERSSARTRSWLERASQRLRPIWPTFSAVSLAAAVLLGLWALSLNSQLARLREETATLRNDLMAQREALAKLSAADVQAAAIQGTELQPAARGRLFADPDGHAAVLVVTGLRPLAPGEVYQFWLIKGDVPVSAGLLTLDAQGQAVLAFEPSQAISSFDAMGVSIEPEGGSPLPTGDIVMAGSL